MSEIFLGKLTRREFRERMQTGELKLCLLPVAAIEQHLEHLAMEHDWRSTCLVAERVARRLQPKVLVAQGLMCGISEHHMRHAGTLSLQPGTFLTVLGDLLDSLERGGFRKIIVLNGHGGNVAPLQGTWDQYLRRFQVNLHWLSYWDVLTVADARELLKSGCRLPEDMPGHAQEFETSTALSAFPENVRTKMWMEQDDPTPAMATADTGTAFLERIVNRVAEYVTEVMDGRRVAETPPFHP